MLGRTRNRKIGDDVNDEIVTEGQDKLVAFASFVIVVVLCTAWWWLPCF